MSVGLWRMSVGLCLHLQQGHAGIEFCLPGSPALCWLPVKVQQQSPERNLVTPKQAEASSPHCAGDTGCDFS